MSTGKVMALMAVIAAASSVAGAAYLSSFEETDGFTVGGAMPTGWSATTHGVRIGTTHSTGFSQSLEVGKNGSSYAYATYQLPSAITSQPGVVTEISVNVRTSSGPVPGDTNFDSFGGVRITDSQGWPVGGVQFNLQDNSYDPNSNPASSFNIWTADPVNPSTMTTSDFAQGVWYRFTTLIDWSASTTTVRLTLLDGTSIHEHSVNRLPPDVTQIRFNGIGYSDTMPAIYDDLYVGVVPEPATMGLLALGGVALLRRRRR